MGRCTNSEGKHASLDEGSGAIRLDEIDDKSDDRLMKCFRKCRGIPLATGCEVFAGVSKNKNGCYAHTRNITFGRVWSRKWQPPQFRACWVFSKCTDGKKSYTIATLNFTSSSDLIR